MIIRVKVRRQFKRCFQRSSETRLNFCSKEVQTEVGHDVLHASALTVSAIAEVAERRDHRGDDLFYFVVRHKRQRLSQPGEGIGVGVGTAESATHEQGEAGARDWVLAGNETNILGKDVDTVIVRVRDGDLELAGQIRFAVEGALFDLLTRRGFLTVHEDLPVRFGRRAKSLAKLSGNALEVAMTTLQVQVWTRHHVSHDVAACAKG